MTIALEASGYSHSYYFGGLVLVILLGALLGMLAFGKGRDHS